MHTKSSLQILWLLADDVNLENPAEQRGGAESE
jgi:hypothetical protein